MLQRLLFPIAIVFLASCAAGPSVPAQQACEASAFTVIDNFAGARRGQCTVIDDNHVRILILPESDGYINDSPWFAFKVLPKADVDATITMTYRGGHHRYRPKISFDRIHWTPLPDEQVRVSSDRLKADISLRTGDKAFWIAAHELLTPAMYSLWETKMVETGHVQASELGRSRGGLPITVLNSNPDARDVLFLVGRQHPPEVSGAVAFLAFYEALMADTELAGQFRQRFQVVAVPMLNPDGVVGGNWRHNLGATDLNRDWGIFQQPETQHIEALLDRLDDAGKKVRVFLDFHSTRRNVFYTQNDDYPTEPPHFTRRWLDRAGLRIRNYEFNNDENPVGKLGVAKNYMYKRYGIPSLTYEVGDETDRPAVRAAATIFAEELMERMLADL